MSSLCSQMCKRVTLKYCWSGGGGTLQWTGITYHIQGGEEIYLSSCFMVASSLSPKGTRSRYSQKLYVCVCHRPDYAQLPPPNKYFATSSNTYRAEHHYICSFAYSSPVYQFLYCLVQLHKFSRP